MNRYKSLKITIIGAGSISFCPATVVDIMLSDSLNRLKIEICLMDINARALEVSQAFALEANKEAGRNVSINSTTDLNKALEGADFVITAIEKERNHYWSQDFHIPRRYGFRQIYGENGGPGGMFHTLRNLGPMLEIAKAMEKICPDAYLINYTNPEAKLVEAIHKLTGIKAVGVCHGFAIGVGQVARILGMPQDKLDVKGHGLNHFGWFTSIRDKSTGQDLYPLLREKEAEGHWLSEWDELGLSRIMLRTYGLWPYPGTNHIGEYIAWSDDFLASSKIQYFFDPVKDKPWETRIPPKFVYSFSSNPTGIDFHTKDNDRELDYQEHFSLRNGKLTRSGEYGIPIIEAIVFDLKEYIPSLNMPNHGTMPGIMEGMCVEGPCLIDKDGIHPIKVDPLPVAVTAMINHQGAIHQLIIDAFVEQSRNKLLQAVLLDPTVSSYNNAVAMIDEMFQLQKDILPPLKWK